MVVEESEYTLLGNWFHFRFDARRGREAFPCNSNQGLARPLRAEKGRDKYFPKNIRHCLVNFKIFRNFLSKVISKRSRCSEREIEKKKILSSLLLAEKGWK